MFFFLSFFLLFLFFEGWGWAHVLISIITFWVGGRRTVCFRVHQLPGLKNSCGRHMQEAQFAPTTPTPPPKYQLGRIVKTG